MPNFSANALRSPTTLPQPSSARGRSRDKKLTRTAAKVTTPPRGSSSARYVNKVSIAPEGTRSRSRTRQKGVRVEGLEGGGLASGVRAEAVRNDVSPEWRRDRATTRATSLAGKPVLPRADHVPRRSRPSQASQAEEAVTLSSEQAAARAVGRRLSKEPSRFSQGLTSTVQGT
jgi:hypothetical protein